MPTLSGGESQRVKMARQLDCNLVDLIYILDEPTVGLHPRDIDHLIAMLHRLRDHGNTVLVVEHDPAVIRAADWIVDMGPRASEGGGELVVGGRLGDLLRADTATSRALNDQVARPRLGRRTFDDAFRIENATSNNLRNLTVRIPKGVLTCVTGVAGSGKSSLVAGARRHPPAPTGRGRTRWRGGCRRSTPRRAFVSFHPATDVGVFDAIRRQQDVLQGRRDLHPGHLDDRPQ